MRRLRHVAALGIGMVLLGAAAPVLADDVTDQLDEARKAYDAKDLATAAAALGAAQDLIRQQSADAWKTMLPEPLPGWTADEATSATAGAALLGGGTNVTRVYRNGGDSVTVELLTDSPVMQGLGRLMSSGLVTGSDNKLLIIGGRKVTYTKSGNSFSTMAADKVLVQVKGSSGVDEKTLKDYLAALHWKDIEKTASR
ncbi:MAG TPA: hypothetical protein VJO12_18205 [Stellaceae bacterium]|nr:hypothetical protein [Stellaceae bacterium]